MQTTRARIIDLLRTRPGATIDDITHGLSLAPATVRRHLDVLQRDGLIETRSVRRALGRPHFVFALTEDGRDSLPEHQLRLTLNILDELLALEPVDTHGRSGRDVASLVFDRFAGRLAQECTPPEAPQDPAERLRSGLQALDARGMDFELIEDAGGLRVRGPGCPCERILSGREEGCSHDAYILATMAEQAVEVILGSDGAREYLLRPLPYGVL